MSACLFTCGRKYLESLSKDALGEHVKHWMDTIEETENTLDWQKNRFLCDRRAGFLESLRLAFLVSLEKGYEPLYTEQASDKNKHDAYLKRFFR